METYRATFDISCGVSHGLGVKYPDTETREERIVAENPDDALKQALTYATRFAYDYLSDPETGKTTVALSHLRGPTGTVPLDTTKTIVNVLRSIRSCFLQ